MEGQDTSAIEKIWVDLAATEMRLELMSELLKLNVGLADIEEFNLNLKANFKNLPSDQVSDKQSSKLVRAAMEPKIVDEQTTRTKLVRSRNIERTKMMKSLGRNTKKYRTTIRKLRQAAWDVKATYKSTYEEKLEHLREVFARKNRK